MKTWGVICLLAMTASAAPERKQPTKAQIKAGRAHMKAGWAAQRAKKWADATSEFEAALKELDGDPRAQSELGWSAMNAGDFKKARLADEAAVAAAIDPKVKAASLYNLGMVQIRLEDVAGARRSFKKSIELRPNKTVSDELAKLDAHPDAAAVASCPKHKQTCECLLHEYLGEDSLCAESKTIKAPAPGWSVYEIGDERDKSALLLDADRDVVAELSGKTDHMRSSTDTSFSKLEALKLAGHTVVHIVTNVSMMSDYMDETKNDSTMEDRTTEQYCTVDGSCVEAPTKIVRNSDITKINADGSYGDITSSKSETSVTMVLDNTGVVTVKLVAGSFEGFNPQLLGPHKLW